MASVCLGTPAWRLYISLRRQHGVCMSWWDASMASVCLGEPIMASLVFDFVYPVQPGKFYNYTGYCKYTNRNPHFWIIPDH